MSTFIIKASEGGAHICQCLERVLEEHPNHHNAEDLERVSWHVHHDEIHWKLLRRGKGNLPCFFEEEVIGFSLCWWWFNGCGRLLQNGGLSVSRLAVESWGVGKARSIYIPCYRYLRDCRSLGDLEFCLLDEQQQDCWKCQSPIWAEEPDTCWVSFVDWNAMRLEVIQLPLIFFVEPGVRYTEYARYLNTYVILTHPPDMGEPRTAGK